MSLTTVPKQFCLGIIAAKGFDNASFLPERLGPHVEQIAHVYTNGVNPLVTAFCIEHGIVYTVFPVTGGKTLSSNNLIADNSDKVYIIGTPESSNTKNIVETCEKKGVKHEIFTFEPIAPWKEKVCRAQEVLSALPKEEIDASAGLKALKGVL